MSFLRKLRDIFATAGVIIVSLGTVWLGSYYGFVVHAVPNVEFGKLVLLISLVGAVGIWLVALLLVFIFASPATLLLYYALSRKLRRKNALMALPLVTYQPRVIGFVHYAWLALWTIAVLAYGHFAPEKWKLPEKSSEALYLTVLLVAPLLIGCFDKIGRLRLPLDTAAVYGMSAFLWLASLDFVHNLLPVNLPNSDKWGGGWFATVILIATPSIIGAMSLTVSLRVAIPFFVCLLTILSPLSGQAVLGAAPRLLNIGAEYRKVTALTNHAAIAIEGCKSPDPMVKPAKYAPYKVSRHFTVFILSDLGDEYIIKCSDVTAIRLSKSEVSQATIAFPGFRIDPL